MATRLFTAISVVVLLAGVVTYSHVKSKRGRVNGLPAGFTVNYTLTENGKVTCLSSKSVKSDGEFLEDYNYINADGTSNRHTRMAGTLKYGAVFIDDAQQKLKYIGNAALVHPQSDVDELNFKQSPDFKGENTLLGFHVLVSQQCFPDGGCSEFWNAPALGGEALRIVFSSTNVVKEATEVKMGEPSFSVPEYPVDNSTYQLMQQKRGKSQ